MGAKIIWDVGVWQPSNLNYFKTLKSKGVYGIIIKLTEGSNPGSAYGNPSAKAQFNNARAAGLKVVGFYHYARFWGDSDAANEADWFIKYKEKVLGITGKDYVMVCDAEDNSLNNSRAGLTSNINSFINRLKSKGYKRVDTYSGRSFIQTRAYPSKLVTKNLWIASYGSASAGMKCGTWQYTDNFKGLGVDASLDYSGFYSKVNPEVTKNKKPTYFSWKPYMVTAKTKIGIYIDKDLTKLKRKYPAGTDFKVSELTKSSKGTPRFKTTSGFYISANKDYVNNSYYVDDTIKEIVALKTIWIYKEATRKHRVAKFSKGTDFVIKDIQDIGHGLTSFKTQSGYWITTNKKFVKKVH